MIKFSESKPAKPNIPNPLAKRRNICRRLIGKFLRGLGSRLSIFYTLRSVRFELANDLPQLFNFHRHDVNQRLLHDSLIHVNKLVGANQCLAIIFPRLFLIGIAVRALQPVQSHSSFFFTRRTAV